MKYKPYDTGLVAELLTGTEYETEVDINPENNPYGICVLGDIVGSVIRNGYLDSGLFVAIQDIDTGESTLYAFSDDLNADKFPPAQFSAWAIGLHLELLGKEAKDISHYHHREHCLSAYLGNPTPDFAPAGDTLYVYLNGIPFSRVTRGRTPTYFFRLDLNEYHTHRHQVASEWKGIWNQYLAEVMKYRNAPPTPPGSSGIYDRTVFAIQTLWDEAHPPATEQDSVEI